MNKQETSADQLSDLGSDKLCKMSEEVTCESAGLLSVGSSRASSNRCRPVSSRSTSSWRRAEVQAEGFKPDPPPRARCI